MRFTVICWAAGATCYHAGL